MAFYRQIQPYGAEDSAPTLGISIPPWIIILAAAIWIVPKLYETHRRTSKEAK